MPARQVILPGYILPVRPERAVLRDHAVVIDGERIAGLMPREEALREHVDVPRLELPDHVLMPGLVNMHTHSPMSLLRGYADDMALDTWLREHIWPAERLHVSEDFIRQGTELAMAEMLLSGTTCFNEMYFFPDIIAASVDDAGMRACIGMPIIEIETPWAADVDTCFDKADAVTAALRGMPLLSTSLAPHAPYTVSNDSLRRLAEMSAGLDLPVYMHLLEIAWEIKHSEAEFSLTPLERLQEFGLLGERFMAVHMVHLSRQDIELVAATGTHVIHCPESNLKLSSGISPVADLLAAGVNVSVGTDGAASNNDLDILAELRTAALLAKGASGDPCALGAWQALDLVTINAARALGLEDQIGSIEPGKQADLCALDLAAPQTQPVHQLASQLVYAASSRQVSHVWVAGRSVLEAGELTTIDLQRVLAQAGEWHERIGVRAA